MKSVLARNIDIKDTLDYALFGIKEPSLLEQFLLLGPIFSGLRTHRYFVGITTSGILFVEVNSRFESKKYRFYKYYELDRLETKSVLKGVQITLILRNGETVAVVFPRVVLGLNSQETETDAAIRVVLEKIKSSKEYFRNQSRNQKRRNQYDKKKNKLKNKRSANSYNKNKEKRRKSV